MAIGTSDGQYHEDNLSYILSQFTPNKQPGSLNALKDLMDNAPAMSGFGDINTNHTVISGAVSSKDIPGLTYIDSHIPAQYHPFLALHEQEERKAMLGGMSYAEAHTKVATPIEKKAVEAAGLDWNKYTKSIDGHLSHIEHEHNTNPPPDPMISPKDADHDPMHHHSSSKIRGKGDPEEGNPEEAHAADLPLQGLPTSPTEKSIQGFQEQLNKMEASGVPYDPFERAALTARQAAPHEIRTEEHEEKVVEHIDKSLETAGYAFGLAGLGKSLLRQYGPKIAKVSWKELVVD